MKKTLLSAIALFMFLNSWSQCEPIFDFGDEEWGVAPDTIVNLAVGDINSFYAQQIDVKVPVNGDPFDVPFEVVVDSASLSQVIGLPDGLSFECNSPLTTPCTFLGGDEGCGVISGIPTEGGIFELDIVVIIHFTSILGPSSLPISQEGYRIQINDPLSLTESETVNEFNLYPNPASTSFDMKFDASSSGIGSVTVMDIVGKKIFQEEYHVNQGFNSFEIAVNDFPEGTYLVRLDLPNASKTTRLVVLH